MARRAPGVVVGEGGPAQGDQQLSVYSDYNNGDHANGIWIEANVFQEQIVGAGNVGDTWIFGFDTKRGNINDNPDLPPAEALAFIKTLDPNNGFALTNFIVFDTTNEDDVWSRYELTIEIDASLPGQILQFGFLNLSTLFQSTGVFYDNVTFEPVSSGACCSALDQCIEVPVTECIGSYQGDGTTCAGDPCPPPPPTAFSAPPRRPARRRRRGRRRPGGPQPGPLDYFAPGGARRRARDLRPDPGGAGPR